MQKRQRAHVRAQHWLPASGAVMAKFRLHRVARGGLRKTVGVLRALVVKKRWALAVVKKKMASLQQHRVDALHTAAVPVRVTEAVMPVVATRAAVQDLATQAQAQVRGGPGPRVAHRAAAADTAATRLRVARALAVVAVTTAIAEALAAVVLATPAVAVATTGEAQVAALKAAAMVVATKAGQARAHHAHAGVIAASHHLTDVAVAAPAVDMAAAPVAAQAATEIAAAVVGAAFLATVGPLLQAAASALAVAQVIVTA